MTDHSPGATQRLHWIILTQGDRPDQLRRAVDSVGEWPVTVVGNGTQVELVGVGSEQTSAVTVLELPSNEGVPGGRARGVDALPEEAQVIGFLDDDAELLSSPAVRRTLAAFDREPELAVVTGRIIDETGTTARRHSPRFGRGGLEQPGHVGVFLGGACIMRRSAYEGVGGYWPDLQYAHEELDLAWRLADEGWTVRYSPELHFFHPRTELSRHPEGWWRTGRNRVMVARRNLPMPVLCLHTLLWFALGTIRAPDGPSRRRYVAGWRQGWRTPVERNPMSYRTVLRLTRIGRPPLL